MRRTAILCLAITMPTAAFAQDADDYEGVYDLTCVDAELIVDVFASQGTLDLAADSAFTIHIPLSCDGASAAEQARFNRESLRSCMETLNDRTTCSAIVGDLTRSVADFNDVLQARIPVAMVTDTRGTEVQGEIAMDARHIWASGWRRSWSYTLDLATGEFRSQAIPLPQLDVTTVEGQGFTCDTFINHAEVLGRIDPEPGTLESGLNAEPSAICIQTDAETGHTDVVEVFGHFRAAIEGELRSP